MSSSSNLDHIHPALHHLAVNVADLTPDPRNARKHSERNLQAIESSLVRFKFREPIVVQREGMVVRAGNGRLEVSRRLGWSHVPAIIVDEADVEATAFAIADNRTAELAEWDWATLATQLRELSTDDDVSLLLGWEEHELTPLLKAEWKPGAIDDDAIFESGGPRASAESSRVVIFSDGQWERLETALSGVEKEEWAERLLRGVEE